MKSLINKLFKKLGYAPIEKAETQPALSFFGQQHPKEHKATVFYDDKNFKILSYECCHKHVAQCHTKHLLPQELIDSIKNILGIEDAALNGKYTIDMVKGYHFEWPELMRKVIPAVQLFLDYPSDKIKSHHHEQHSVSRS